jgi:hypothetical protein
VWAEHSVKEVRVEEDTIYNGETYRKGEIFVLGMDLPERVGMSAHVIEGSDPHEVNDPYARNNNRSGQKRRTPSAAYSAPDDDNMGMSTPSRNKRSKFNPDAETGPPANPFIASRKRGRSVRETGETDADVAAKKQRAFESTIPPPRRVVETREDMLRADGLNGAFSDFVSAGYSG